jgi:hypothetical protein
MMCRLAYYKGQFWLSTKMGVSGIIGKANMMFALDAIIELAFCCGGTNTFECVSLSRICY